MNRYNLVIDSQRDVSALLLHVPMQNVVASKRMSSSLLEEHWFVSFSSSASIEDIENALVMCDAGDACNLLVMVD